MFLRISTELNNLSINILVSRISRRFKNEFFIKNWLFRIRFFLCFVKFIFLWYMFLLLFSFYYTLKPRGFKGLNPLYHHFLYISRLVRFISYCIKRFKCKSMFMLTTSMQPEGHTSIDSCINCFYQSRINPLKSLKGYW